MNKQSNESIARLVNIGIGFNDALYLRRIAMTLHRWFELECGDGNDNGSWAIERDDETEIPYFVHHHYLRDRGENYNYITRRKIPDREKGARKRLAKIMARYPNHWAYVQTDPRGAPLYVGEYNPATKGSDPDLFYNSGVALFR
jgi:hypothetical protein